MTHTFAICAYKESSYLEACIKSLRKQTVKSNIIIATSTPNDLIRGLAEKYELPLFINEGETGITGDWNFAYSCADTDLITIAHQDDVYLPDYTEKLLKAMEKCKDPIIYFTDYAELRNGRIVASNKLLKIKRIMLLPLIPGFSRRSRFIRRRVLSMGNPICCPSVTFYREKCGEKPFDSGFKASCDWQAWEKLSKLKGTFYYKAKPLMYHRIHEESETSHVLSDTGRTFEDLQMYEKFWPKPIARFLAKKYSKSEESNTVDE
ncbi:MAG: glycosyltransferase [Lachnospiraceae bacterium]|nr:glycosyltransferase [Lachnospiraceae bacterium]